MTNYRLRLLQGVFATVLCLNHPVSFAEGSGHDTAAVRIAVVNVANLLEKAPQAIDADNRLKSKYATQEQQLDAEKAALRQAQDDLKQQVESGTLSADDQLQRERELRSRERTYRRSLEDYRDAVSNDRAQALDKLQTEIFSAIEKVREQDGIDIIFRENTYITSSQRIDVTSRVLDFLVALKNQAEQAQPPSKPQE